VDFAIATKTPTKETIQKEYDGINYYLLPGGHAVYYKRPESEAMDEWKSIFEKEKPDVLQIWGTEYSHAVPALKVAKEMGIPSVVYIQGVMSAIEKYADGLVKTSTPLRYITLRDIYRNQLWLNQNGWFKKRARVEKQILALSGNIVVENNWAEWMCKAVNPSLGVFKIPLNINEVFFEKKWDFLFDYNLEITHKMCELLDIHTEIRLTEEYQGCTRNQVNDCKPYYQVFKSRHGFLPDLSILDLLFNMGPESILCLINK
jgi:hypothetical protein